MIGLLSVAFFVYTAPAALAIISVDYSCTTIANGFVYDNIASACSNVIGDASCASIYRTPLFPLPGDNTQRPNLCFSSDGGATFNQGMVDFAVQNCPKTCGMCCKTSAYNCRNAPLPVRDCATVTQSECSNPIWRPILEQNCPATCGFCNVGGCVDTMTGCTISMCTTIGLEQIVNEHCKRTCGRCENNNNPPPGCINYPADSSTSCRAWANNGFCTNTFYDNATRRQYCATTCRIC